MALFDAGLLYDSSVHYDAAPPPPGNPPTRMAKAKLNLDNKNPQEVLAASAAHIAAMATPEGQALFATPDPSVVDYQAVHDALGTGINLVTSLEGQLDAARNALPGLVAALKAEMEARAIYVDATTDGDPAQIPVSGFAVAAPTGVPIGPLPRPENVKAVMGKFPGVIRVSCDAIHGAQSYITDCRLHDEPGDDWQQVKISTKSRNDVTGMISGKNYAFRIAAVGAAGQSPWGDEAVCMAP